MFAFLALFIPSIIGIRIINYFNKDLKIKDMIYDYITLFLFSFIVNNFVLFNFFGIKENIFSKLNTDIMLFVWISLISIAVNIILCFIGLVVQKNIEFKIEVQRNEVKTKAVSSSNNKVNTKDSKDNKKTRKTASKTVKKDKTK